MLAKISAFFEKLIINQEDNSDSQEHQLNLAVAALMFEMVYIDNQVTEAERLQLENILIKQYGLHEDEVSSISQLAKLELESATDYYQFTALINQHFSKENKVNIIKQLWKIALSDGNISHYEEHYVRKIADLLFVPHSDFIKTKLMVIEQ
ncbi:tellurite resistance TerB family protein [Aliikangiella sp. IMCC44359]|uniref:tellurite resistance TerB family protein n=1 Tax=Aliikangiella sp. IMCC44359 TaxID=3459125 RepID=UPI00403AF109